MNRTKHFLPACSAAVDRPGLGITTRCRHPATAGGNGLCSVHARSVRLRERHAQVEREREAIARLADAAGALRGWELEALVARGRATSGPMYDLAEAVRAVHALRGRVGAS